MEMSKNKKRRRKLHKKEEKKEDKVHKLASTEISSFSKGTPPTST
jgi:hypothetical protein